MNVHSPKTLNQQIQERIEFLLEHPAMADLRKDMMLRDAAEDPAVLIERLEVLQAILRKRTERKGATDRHEAPVDAA